MENVTDELFIVPQDQLDLAEALGNREANGLPAEFAALALSRHGDHLRRGDAPLAEDITNLTHVQIVSTLGSLTDRSERN